MYTWSEQKFANETLLCRRDHSKKYTCRPNGEIQSEGIGIDGAISIEGASVYFKPSDFHVYESSCGENCSRGKDEFREIIFYHIADDKKQNAATVYCNIMHMIK